MNRPGARLGPLLQRALVVVLYGFLLAPLFPVLIISFSADAYLSFPPSGWSFRWYAALLDNQRFIDGMQVSLAVAAVSTVLALVAGVPAAYAIARMRLPGRDFLLGLFTAPLVVPSIVLGLGLLLVLVQVHLNGTLTGLLAAHTLLVTPFVIRIVLTGLTTLPPDVEAAAASLGATPLRVFRRITLPLLRPALLGSAGLSFLISFDEVAVSLFIVGTNMATLPVAIFRYTADHTDPSIAALSVLLIAVSVVIILLIERAVGLMRAMGR